jgi:hypothetical protein
MAHRSANTVYFTPPLKSPGPTPNGSPAVANMVNGGLRLFLDDLGAWRGLISVPIPVEITVCGEFAWTK